MPKYALISVFDKTGVVDLAKTLSRLNYQIISTGGTAKTLKEAGIKIIPVEEVTENPESFDGRMKTISFQIGSGILYDRTNSKHMSEAKKLKVKSIDVVVCNLYPFEEKQTIENIDIGGPTMIRAAAKNHKNVIVIVDPSDYKPLQVALEKDKVTAKLRKSLAAKAFGHVSFYDSQVAKFLNTEKFPGEMTLPGRAGIGLRYGENPHQKSVVYFEPNTDSPLLKIKGLSGRGLSYVNFTDIAAGLESVRLFKEPAAVVIKHNSPCGIALGSNAAQALSRAIEADPVSAFGGVVVLNTKLDLASAKIIAKFKENHGQFDIIAAAEIEPAAQELITKVRRTTGIYTFGKVTQRKPGDLHARFFDGGFVLQDWDDELEDGFKIWKVASKKKPSKKQLEQMKIGWKFITRIRSNAVIIIDPRIPMTRGIGSGQTSRVASTGIALKQAGKYAKGAIMVSDSFFPFDDSARLAAKHGIAAIVQQGGSVNDKLSVDAANKHGLVMVMTGRRAFSH